MRTMSSVAAVSGVVAGRAVAVMAVDGVSAQSADAAADERTCQRVAIEGRRESGAGYGTDSGGGKDAMFTRAAGCKTEAEQSDEKDRECAAHIILLQE
jgi:hypothetical protein